MARHKLLSPMNAVNGLVGLFAVGAVATYLVRRIRIARLEAAEGNLAGRTMMNLRRAGRMAGRNVKDAAQQVGQEIRRRVDDTAAVLADMESPYGRPTR